MSRVNPTQPLMQKLVEPRGPVKDGRMAHAVDNQAHARLERFNQPLPVDHVNHVVSGPVHDQDALPADLVSHACQLGVRLVVAGRGEQLAEEARPREGALAAGAASPLVQLLRLQPLEVGVEAR
ncbi:hypothetical protein E4U41_007387, partial [Claviceps citrina]